MGLKPKTTHVSNKAKQITADTTETAVTDTILIHQLLNQDPRFKADHAAALLSLPRRN